MARQPAAGETARIIGLLALAVVVVILSGRPGFAMGDDRRLLAAQLLIIQGDLGRFAMDGLPEAQRQGLDQRIRGLLGGLAWEFRLVDDPDRADQARRFATDPQFSPDNPAFGPWIADAVGRYPFTIAGFDPDRVRSGDRPKALAIHESFCAGCHDGTPDDVNTPLPALDLYGMAERMPAEELLARILNGVRGDQVTGLANPLSDAQIAALAALYRAGAGR